MTATTTVPPADDRAPIDVLLSTWLEWEQWPASKPAAIAKVDAQIVFADELGITSVEVNRAMAAGRRQGLAHDTILDQLKMAAPGGRSPAELQRVLETAAAAHIRLAQGQPITGRDRQCINTAKAVAARAAQRRGAAA